MTTEKVTKENVVQAHERLRPYVRQTPVFDYQTGRLDSAVNFKFEHLQASGTFKVRGAFNNLLSLSEDARQQGVTCVSAGNHAVAVAYAAHQMGVKAKTVMIKTASPARVALCREYGAEIVFADNGEQAFELVRQIEKNEQKTFIHPFSTYPTVLGTATLGYEWLQQAGKLDAVLVPIGGGGLAAGVSAAVKLWQPDCVVYGIEPVGANVMALSRQAGEPQKIGAMQSIADSLMAPHTDEFSFRVCQDNIDTLVTVNDDQIRAGMHFLFNEFKMATEPACAVATAALMFPLRKHLAGQRVGVLFCGSNTDTDTFIRHITTPLAQG